MTAPQAFPTTLGAFNLPTWAEDGDADVSDPGSSVANAGFNDGEMLSAELLNWSPKHQAQWLRAFAARAPDGSANLFGTWAQSSASWTAIAAGLNATLAASTLWLDCDDTGAVKVQVRVVVGNPHTFAASRDTYVFVSDANMLALHDDATSMVFTAVGLGDPVPSTPAGFVLVWKVVTDGTTIDDQELLLPERPTFRNLGALDLTLDSISTGTLMVSDASTMGSISATSLSTSGTVTCGTNLSVGGNLDMTSGNISNANTISSGDITCTGLTASAAITAAGEITGTTLVATGSITCGGNLDMTSGTIANAAVVSTATLTCGSASFSGAVDASAVVVRMLEADFSATTLTVDAGELRWDGTKLAVGDGTNAKPIAMYYEVFTETPGGGGGALAGSVVSGSSITVALTTGDIVWIEGGMETTNSLNLSPSAGLEVNTGGGGTVVLHATTRKIAVAGDFADVNIRYRYTALATTNHTFRMTHGAATGNTTSRNVGVTVRHTL